MKKKFMIAALLAVMIVASSGMGRRMPEIKSGCLSPELVIADSVHCVDISSYRGSYVLISFWSSTDAPSRVAVKAYDTAVRNRSVAGLHHVSVNFDDSKELFEAIVKADRLDAAAQFNATGKTAESIIANFNLRNGYGSLLIDPDGKIAAINPDVSNLTAI